METYSLLAETRQLNAKVYIDYDNLAELVTKSGQDLREMDFFKIIKEKLKIARLNIVDFITFGNPEKVAVNVRKQSLLPVHKKRSGGLESIVNALKDLYRNPAIDLFIIASSGRDIVPLLQEIKHQHKLTYVLSTKNLFNQSVAQYADFHEFVEDIFRFV